MLTSPEVLFTLKKQESCESCGIHTKKSNTTTTKTERVSSCWTSNEITYNLVLKPVFWNIQYILQKAYSAFSETMKPLLISLEVYLLYSFEWSLRTCLGQTPLTDHLRCHKTDLSRIILQISLQIDNQKKI